MEMSQVAKKYLTAFFGNAEIPGGLSYQKALGQCNFDWKIGRLQRIDILLDQIREKQKPDFDDFLSVHANQNFLYVLCFYVGVTVAKNSGQAIEWQAYKDVIAAEPSLAAVWKPVFETSVACMLRKPDGT